MRASPIVLAGNNSSDRGAVRRIFVSRFTARAKRFATRSVHADPEILAQIMIDLANELADLVHAVVNHANDYAGTVPSAFQRVESIDKLGCNKVLSIFAIVLR